MFSQVPTLKVAPTCQTFILFNKPGEAGAILQTPLSSKQNYLKTTLSKNKYIYIYLLCDALHMTCDICHVTHDTWHVTCCGWWTFSQHFSSLALTVCDLWYFEDLNISIISKEKTKSLSFCVAKEGPKASHPGLLSKNVSIMDQGQGLFHKHRCQYFLNSFRYKPDK